MSDNNPMPCPCPWCGGGATADASGRWVLCGNVGCLASGPVSPTPSDAVTAWNRVAAAARLADAVARLHDANNAWFDRITAAEGIAPGEVHEYESRFLGAKDAEQEAADAYRAAKAAEGVVGNG